MVKKNNPDLEAELQKVQAEFAALSIRLARITQLVAEQRTPPPRRRRHGFEEGNHVRFHIDNVGVVEGTVVDFTRHFVLISYNGGVVRRAPHNITLITDDAEGDSDIE